MAPRPNILLLNPPSRRRVLRDYYCSTWPKAGAYYWEPIDLLAAAARLGGRARITLVDAPARGTRITELDALQADAAFVLVSSVTREGDLAVAERLARRGCRIVLGGEVALDADFDFGAHPWVHALCLDFTAPELTECLLTGEIRGRLRSADHEPTAPASGTFSLGRMPHERLRRRDYRLPPWRGSFYSLLTDFGCPYTCSFCNSGRGVLGYQTRDVDEIAAEATWLARHGAERIYLKDMTFGARREHRQAVLGALAPHGFDLRGYLRADLVSEEFADELAGAGFSFAQLGVESPSERERRALGKNLADDALFEATARLRRRGIRVGLHFVVGFEGQRLSEAGRCAELAESLGASYCSINVYTPRAGIAPLPAFGSGRRRPQEVLAALHMLRFNVSAQLRETRPRLRGAFG